MTDHSLSGVRKNSKQNQNARNESWEKEREPKREARGDAEELTETRRSPRQQATRGGGGARVVEGETETDIMQVIAEQLLGSCSWSRSDPVMLLADNSACVDIVVVTVVHLDASHSTPTGHTRISVFPMQPTSCFC